MRYKYFIGEIEHEIHSEFIRSILPGDSVYTDTGYHSTSFPDEIYDHDGKDVVWFFTHIIPNLHKTLKGKQVYIDHGLGFKPFCSKIQASIINSFIELVFSTGVANEKIFLNAGIKSERIKQIGYSIVLKIPKCEVEKNAILFTSTRFDHWSHFKNLERILKKLDKKWHGYVTLHPRTTEENKNIFEDICDCRANLTLVETQEELLKCFSLCRCVVGGLSSTCTPFYFLKKPVIFLRGTPSRNPFKWNDWSREKAHVNSEIFNQVLDGSEKISHGIQFNSKVVERAKWVPASKEMFYPWNTDKNEVESRIIKAVQSLSENVVNE